MNLRDGAVALWVILASTVPGWLHPVLSATASELATIDPALLATLARGGEVSYLVYLREQAALAGAEAILDRAARGRFVYRALKEVADRTQAPLLAYLTAEVQAGRAREIRSFFSANALAVTSAEPTLRGLAGFPEVERILSGPILHIPEPQPGLEQSQVQGVEWNIAKIGAPAMWAHGVFGQGVVVANIDTGVQFTHPALVRQYRGNLGGGTFDHNYHWWDPSKVCGNPSRTPCDRDDAGQLAGHGTYTMGIMVGDDGGANKIGVAPKATWFACKGCEDNTCSSIALLECGDFILAPWDLNKANPDPSKRPHIVNNSWGGDGGDPFYRRTVQSWRAAGIFPAFSVGNRGPFCNSAGSPGDYPDSFSTGATDVFDGLTDVSSRGPSLFGVTKPDIVAPGWHVRSSVPTNGYAAASGTSAASPHTAGTVALLWSFFPGLARDVPGTERKLRSTTAIFNTTDGCGGDNATTHPNNAFGWGRVDALRASTPLNIYTDRSVYQAGDSMVVHLSLVNPLEVSVKVDLYVAVQFPSGQLLFFPSGRTVPTPLATNIRIDPLLKVFDVNILNYTFGGDPVGNYTWFAVLTPVGANPFDSSQWLTIDLAPFTKQ
jgi:subtilisin family serine protease